MGLRCRIFGHQWNGCKCTKCGQTRDEGHVWYGCKCAKCETTKKVEIPYDERIVIPFGTYKQGENGIVKPIEWITLDKDGDYTLVVSKYLLDCQPYHKDYSSVSWEYCSLRKWLNDAFLNDAFTKEEQSRIKLVSLFYGKNDFDYPRSDCQVFLLSLNELCIFFRDDSERMCAPTNYALSRGVSIVEKYKVDGNATGWWFLRSPGFLNNRAAYVLNSGRIYTDAIGYNVSDAGGIRPAMWVKLDS